MTTTVTLKTHSWPVLVTTVDIYERDQTTGDSKQSVLTETTTVETVPPETERSFHITNSRSVSFDELPIPEVQPEETK